MSNPAFAQTTPGLTTSPFPVQAGIATEATVSSYAQVYTNKALTSAVATTAGFVDNNGNVVIDLNNATVDMISVAGTKTNDATHTSGGNPTSQGAQSIGGTYIVLIADQQKGFNFWKNGTFSAAFLSSLATAPSRIAISPNGKYVLLTDSTDNTVELWVGS